MTERHTVLTGSQSWQPNFIAQRKPDVSRYLGEASQTDFIQRVAVRTLELISPLAGRSALEVGYGNGVFLPRLAEAVGTDGRVVGVDHSEAFIAEAKARVESAGLADAVTVQQGNAYRLPFPASTFDAVHCERVLMHLDDPSAALAEMRRVVRPGGVDRSGRARLGWHPGRPRRSRRHGSDTCTCHAKPAA